MILLAMKDALESLMWIGTGSGKGTVPTSKAIANLIVAIEEMEKAEPVAWVDHNGELQSFADTGWVPLYLHPAPAIPEGWQLVPIESTKEMSDAFWSAYIPENKTAGAQASSFEDWWDFIHMYKAMLATAPEYKQ